MRLSRRRLLQLGGAAAVLAPRRAAAQRWWKGQAHGPQSPSGGTWNIRGTTLLDGRGPVAGTVTDFKDLQGWGEQPKLAVDSGNLVYCVWVHNASPEANGGPADAPRGFSTATQSAQYAVNAGSLRVKTWNAGATRWDYVAANGAS